MNNYFIISIYIICNRIDWFYQMFNILEVFTVEVTLAVTLAYVFLTTIVSLISVIFYNNIFNFFSVFIKLLIIVDNVMLYLN